MYGGQTLRLFGSLLSTSTVQQTRPFVVSQPQERYLGLSRHSPPYPLSLPHNPTKLSRLLRLCVGRTCPTFHLAACSNLPAVSSAMSKLHIPRHVYLSALSSAHNTRHERKLIICCFRGYATDKMPTVVSSSKRWSDHARLTKSTFSPLS